jgi:hypothetical protein
MKRTLLNLGALLSVSSLLASTAFGFAYPRIRNPGTEHICANPDLFDSLAAGQLCQSYYNNNTWNGAGGRWIWTPSNSHSSYDPANDQFERLDRPYTNGRR